jgi:TM2 domain-containing membrane protein YozV
MTTGRAVRAELSIIADFGAHRQPGVYTKILLRPAILTDTASFSSSFASMSPALSTPHKNKTVATFLALVLGGVGAHRFYLRGSLDRIGLLHLCSLPIAGLVTGLAPDANWFYKVLPLLVSYCAGFIEGLVIGLMPDEKYDAAYNAGSGRQSDSAWPLAVLLVGTMLVGAVMVIGTMSRLFDLLYTGGAYG